jgi:hypothetical protein
MRERIILHNSPVPLQLVLFLTYIVDIFGFEVPPPVEIRHHG